MQVTTHSCPVCGEPPSATLASLERVPATCNALWPTEVEARRAPVGDLDLLACAGCGFVWNGAFQPELVDYSQRYENCLAFSRVFSAYSEELARWLVDRHDLRGKRIVEVGAGSGEFLGLLCTLGGNRGIGFDPSYDADEAEGADNLDMIAEEFPPSRPTTADFVVCRHVLEHIDSPGAVLDAIAQSILPASGWQVQAYLEVPNAAYMFAREMIWDVIYEHCGYFSAPNLQLLAERTGSSVRDIGASYGGQYLWVELEIGNGSTARPSGGRTSPSRLRGGLGIPHPPDLRPFPGEATTPPPSSPEEVVADALTFGANFSDTIARWSHRLDELCADGEVVAWGAGSKGVMFCNLVGAGRITRIVDASPRKHGLFLPGSAQEVIPPEVLVESRPRHVIVMNPLYLDEIRATLAGLGVEANVVPVDIDIDTEGDTEAQGVSPSLP